ncbi:MAG TPA: COR domain-containing protein, partial [Saprospiraceae bacterium]|nr:COR domain-containing protein [Saprospiraceae bacterium]
ASKRGRFNKNDLVRVWNEGYYTKRRDELLALMLQFELCYQVQDTDTYVAPQLLPGDVPEYNLGIDIPLQLKYEYGFMPKGLFYRLIVRLHRHIAQQQSAVWNSGVVLEKTGAQADILESLDRRQISVRVTGMRAKELATIINEEFEKLHSTYGKGLKVEVNIPCNCNICRLSNTPHFFNLTDDLEFRLKKGKKTIECGVSFEDVPVRELLDGVFMKTDIDPLSISNRSFIGSRIKKLFISYSHKDESLKNDLDIHLTALKHSNQIEVWHDRMIDAGTEWDDKIKSELEEADIILLLISPYFQSSKYIWEIEIARAMERHKAGQTRVIPIFLRPCLIKGMPYEKLQGLPRDAKTVTSFSDPHEAYTQIVEGISAVLDE